jgi:polyhydroxybutyrate depolymerase
VDWQKPVPLVLVFHGGTGNAQSAVLMSGFNKVADQNGFIVAYPNGTGRLQNDILLTWNGGTCCGYAQVNNADDVGFVRAVVAEMQSLTTIDSQRIYATGMSNGGILSHRLACEASDLFAAVGPVAGTLNYLGCSPAESISVIAFHGTADQHIPYEGGFGPQSLVEVDFESVPDSIDFWVSHNQCSPEPAVNIVDDVEHKNWSGCGGGTAVELYSIIDGGHAWPGGLAGREAADQPTKKISASQLIWDFFAAHPKY